MEDQKDRVEGDGSQMQECTAEITSSASSEIGFNSDRRSNLSGLLVPCRPEVAAKPTASSSQLPPLSATKSGKNSASHGQGPRPHLRSRASLEKNKINILVTGSQNVPPTLPGIPPTPLADKRASSLPVRTLNVHSSGTNPDFIKPHSHELPITQHSEPGHEKVNIIRSFSTPVIGDKVESFRRDGKGYVLLRSASPRTHAVQPSRESDPVDAIINAHMSIDFDIEKGKGSTKDEVEEAIPEEEAVCRICMDSLTEDYGETLKMECRCRGEMALAHKECAFKWFGIKGDRVCEVCGSVVSNIPVTVVRFPVNETISHTRSIDVQTVNRASVWQDIPVMAIINMMAYFCFIEQLLVNKLGTKALAISIPFSVIIGLLASVTTIALVSRRYIWMYASIQFGLVCLFGYVFFYKTQLEAVLAVLLAAFSGFGMAMTSNALILEYMHWKQYTARRAQSAAASTVDVEVSFREGVSGELAANNSQWSRELATSQATSRDLETGSESATARGSPSARSQAASESHSMHCS
ncbi:hypothetical protein M758_8G189100 [Ceratodon purpureus]|uniref:RING-CH-type domain-containing protein n=1 Tax=Ceratodon purpureus TaxID=3225 RepID=A0A8T0H053_CERPU|nr:hypothetical protein KC19_8G193900 [Ceratodon purpureus]KAG0609496.1 hypothetical protein M758_8G189100 [Ceratodon purpureus]